MAICSIFMVEILVAKNGSKNLFFHIAYVWLYYYSQR